MHSISQNSFINSFTKTHNALNINMMKKIVLFSLLCMLTYSTCWAQEKTVTKKERTIFLWGHIKDSFTKDGIRNAKITLMHPDSTVVDTMSVNYYDHGSWIDSYYKFEVPARPQKFIIKAEQPDYQTTFINYEIKYVARNTYFDAPWHLMKKAEKKEAEQSHTLKEVVVQATQVKLVYKGDTLVYNADAFKLSKGSMLDELVKQMPGVKLTDKGEIFLNGKKVDYLLLNGKEFIKGDNKVMLENLPSYVVKNIQFYDKTTDKSKYLGYDAEKKEFVMDVKLKKEYSVGYTANADVAKGSDDRYMGRFFGLRYTPQTYLAIFGNFNNVNEYRNPGSDGDWTPANSPEGLMDVKRAGFHFSVDDKDQKYSGVLSGQLFWTNSDYASQKASESFLSTGNSYSRSKSEEKYKNFRTSLYQYFTLKKPFYLEVSNQIWYRENDWMEQSSSATFNADPKKYGNIGQVLDSVFKSPLSSSMSSMAVNRQTNSTIGSGHTTETYSSVVATKKLIWGDDIEFSYDLNYNNGLNSSYNAYQLNYLQSTASSDSRDQYITDPNKSYNYKAKAQYTVHLLNRWSYLFYYIYGQDYSSEINSRYRLDWLDGWSSGGHSLGDLPSTRDSLLLALDAGNTYKKTYIMRSHQEGFRVFYEKDTKGKYIWFNLHLPFRYKNERMNYQRNLLDTCVRANNWLFQPDMTFILKTHNYNRQYQANYSTVINTPDLVQMINIRDDSNPLAVSLGNPDLKNTVTHNFSLSFSDRNRETQRFFNVNTGLSIVKRKIANGFTYDAETGVYTYKPENVDGNWSFNLSQGYGNAIDKKKCWTWETNASWYYNRNVDLTAVSGSTASSLSKVNNHTVEERLKLSYQQGKLKGNLLGRLQWTNATSERENFQTINAFEFNYGITGGYKLPGDIDFDTDLKIYSRRGYGNASMNTNDLVWNASLTRSFLKGKVITKVDGFDLLHQLSSVSYYVNGQGRTETFYNTIPSYVMVHFIYRISFNPKKEKK